MISDAHCRMPESHEIDSLITYLAFYAELLRGSHYLSHAYLSEGRIIEARRWARLSDHRVTQLRDLCEKFLRATAP